MIVKHGNLDISDVLLSVSHSTTCLILVLVFQDHYIFDIGLFTQYLIVRNLSKTIKAESLWKAGGYGLQIYLEKNNTKNLDGRKERGTPIGPNQVPHYRGDTGKHQPDLGINSIQMHNRATGPYTS